MKKFQEVKVLTTLPVFEGFYNTIWEPPYNPEYPYNEIDHGLQDEIIKFLIEKEKIEISNSDILTIDVQWKDVFERIAKILITRFNQFLNHVPGHCCCSFNKVTYPIDYACENNKIIVSMGIKKPTELHRFFVNIVLEDTHRFKDFLKSYFGKMTVSENLDVMYQLTALESKMWAGDWGAEDPFHVFFTYLFENFKHFGLRNSEENSFLEERFSNGKSLSKILFEIYRVFSKRTLEDYFKVDNSTYRKIIKEHSTIVERTDAKKTNI